MAGVSPCGLEATIKSMTDQSKKQLHSKGVLSDYFILEGHIASTRSADVYGALDKNHHQGVSLWMLRHPLALNSEAVERFLARIKSIRELTPPVGTILDFGVDSAGMAFVVCPPLDGYPIIGGNKDLTEAERRFAACVRLIDRLHSNQIVCGELCHSSFWVDREGEISLAGVMGSFDTEAVATAMLPPLETLHYVSPEQRAGGGVDKAADVFSLGVLGYRLFADRFPFGDDSSVFSGELDLAQVPPISDFCPNCPPWIDAVVRRCLAVEPEARYQSAKVLLQGIFEARQRAFSDSELPARTRQDVIPRRSRVDVPPSASPALFRNAAAAVTAKKSDEAEEEGAPKVRPRILIAMLGVFFLSLFAVWQIAQRRRIDRETPQVDLSLYRAAAEGNEKLKGAIDAISEAQVALAEKAAKLEEVVNSDDPLAYDILVKSALEASSAELRKLSEKAVVDRARRMGLTRSAEQIRQWLRIIPAGQRPPSYEPLLRSLNNSLPQERRDAAIREAYASDPKVTLRLAAALALDSGKVDSFQPILSQLVGDSLGMQDAKEHSTLALILAHQELAMVFGDDVVQRRSELPDVDVVWLLKLLGDRNDLNVRAFANLAVERGALSPLRRMFLSVVRDRDDLPSDILNALVKASAGSLSLEDVGAFGRWYDTDSERLLLAICAEASDPDVLVEAFDIVAGKSLSAESSAALIDWVRRSQWDKRGTFVRAIGILSNADSVSAEQIREAVAAFDPYIKDRRIIAIFMEMNNPVVSRAMVEKHGRQLPLNILLNLLSHQDRETRILAIQALKDSGVQELGALKMIVDRYEQEKDESIRQIYRDSFWMIKERQ